MELEIAESQKDCVKVIVKGESHTLCNLLREKSWEAGAKQAAYMVEHPYMSDPKIIVRAANPKKVLRDAAQMVVDEAMDFEKEFKRALKR
ncbi:MAG: DNA-directed RNA polymerase subunit L [Candidatus Aenigmarchaeota archaeon]|nr:DNA-directed RNA polymerase subunit L [Candidatus Aenigmarchaeota archaeon]